MRRWLAALLLAAGLAGGAHAVQPDEILDDPVLEARARALSAELRCLVCQNQSIDDSNSELARELRLLIREQLVAGMTNGEIIDYLVARYGQFVLLKPQFNTTTAILWLAPAVLLIGGGILAVRVLRRRSQSGGETAELSPDEEKRLRKILGGSNPT